MSLVELESLNGMFLRFYRFVRLNRMCDNGPYHVSELIQNGPNTLKNYFSLTTPRKQTGLTH